MMLQLRHRTAISISAVLFGFLGLCDVLRRYGVIDVFYSDAGMNFRRQITGKYSIKYFSELAVTLESIFILNSFVLSFFLSSEFFLIIS